MFVAASCGKVFSFLEEVLSLERANRAKSCSVRKDAIHQFTRQGQHPFFFLNNSTHTQFPEISKYTHSTQYM